MFAHRSRSFAVLTVFLFGGAGLLLLAGCPRNQAPDAPESPTGPSSGFVDSTYTFSTVTTDPDGDSVAYRFAWGQGETTDWNGPLASGLAAVDSHVWSEVGSYAIVGQAQDVLGSESPWSDALSVAIGPYPNDPPTLPHLRGPDSTRERIAKTYHAWAWDPDDDSLQIRVAWGDGDTSDWSELLEPDRQTEFEHAWQTAGQYVLRAQARDTLGAESGWSEGLDVSVVAVPYPYRRVATFALSGGPEEAALSPDGQLLYVALCGSNAVAVVRTADLVEVARVQVGETPFHLALLPDGKYLYVSNSYSGDVSVIRTDDNTVIATIPARSFPYGIAALPSGKRVYVANYMADYISVIDTERNEVIGTVSVDQWPGPICAHPNGEFVYASMQRPNSRTAVIRTVDDSIVAWPKTWLYPFGLTVSPDGQHLYATCCTSIVVIRTSDHEVVEHIGVDESYGVYAPGFLPDGEYMFVTSYGHPRLLVFRASDHVLVDSIPVPGPSTGLAIAPDGSRVYLTHFDCDSVSVIGY